MAVDAASAPNNAFGDWLASLLFPGGNPGALEQRAQLYGQLRDVLAGHRRSLTEQVDALHTSGGWSGTAADAFKQDATDISTALDDLAHGYDLAAQALTAQAEQKRQQQWLAGALWVTIGLTAVSAGLVFLAPAVAGAAAAAGGVEVAATAAGGVEAAEGNAVLRMLAQVWSRVVAVAAEVATYVGRLFTQALSLLRDLVAKVGIASDGLKTMRFYAGLTYLARGLEKSWQAWDWGTNPLPALGEGFNPANWTSADWANLLLITAAGPFIAASPIAGMVAGTRIPVPLASAIGLPAGVVAGPMAGAIVDGAVWNGGVTALGAFGVNGQPLDDSDAWKSVAMSTALGGAAGAGASAYAAGRGERKIAGMDLTKLGRTVIAFPADVSIAAGTESPAPPTTAPPRVAKKEPPKEEFRPEFVGGKQVTVEPDDTLSEIAERDLHSARQWPGLQQANPDDVDGHPDLIHPGDVIDEPLLLDPDSPAN